MSHVVVPALAGGVEDRVCGYRCLSVHIQYLRLAGTSPAYQRWVGKNRPGSVFLVSARREDGTRSKKSVRRLTVNVPHFLFHAHLAAGLRLDRDKIGPRVQCSLGTSVPGLTHPRYSRFLFGVRSWGNYRSMGGQRETELRKT